MSSTGINNGGWMRHRQRQKTRAWIKHEGYYFNIKKDATAADIGHCNLTKRMAHMPVAARRKAQEHGALSTRLKNMKVTLPKV